jgi:hypothetical protein
VEPAPGADHGQRDDRRGTGKARPILFTTSPSSPSKRLCDQARRELDDPVAQCCLRLRGLFGGHADTRAIG